MKSRYLTEEDLEAIRQLPEHEQKAAATKLQRKRRHEANREEDLRRAKAYRDAHKSELAAYNKAYREAHREEIRVHQKASRKAYREAYREAHREEMQAYQKAYREAHREKMQAYQKAYQESHREKIQAYKKAYHKSYRESHREAYAAARRSERKERMAPAYRKKAALYRKVVSLWEAGTSAKGIAKELPLSYYTVNRMLITAGLVETEASKLFATGMSMEEISNAIGHSIPYIKQRIPYPPDTPFLEYVNEETPEP